MPIRSYFDELDPDEKEKFRNCLSSMVEEGSDSEVRTLRRTLENVGREIEKREAEREKIRSRIELLRQCIQSLQDERNGSRDVDLEVTFLLGVLRDRQLYLHDRVGEINVHEKKLKKARLSDALRSVLHRRNISLIIQGNLIEEESTPSSTT